AADAIFQRVLGIMHHQDALLFRLLESFRMEIVTALFLGLLLFDRDAILVRPGVLPNSGDLPTDFYTRRVGLNREAIAFDFFGNDRLRELAYYRELVTEVAIESLEPLWQFNDRLAVAVGRDVAVIDIHHVRRFNERMREVFVFGIEGMVNS